MLIAAKTLIGLVAVVPIAILVARPVPASSAG